MPDARERSGVVPPAESGPGTEPQPLEWSFNPWRDRPRHALAAIGMAAGIVLLVGTLGEPLVVRVALGLVAVAALAPMLVPARCRVDADGVTRRDLLGTARRSWSELRRGVAAPAGLLVSPYGRPHWLDPYRGLMLPIPPRARAQLLADLSPHLRGHGL